MITPIGSLVATGGTRRACVGLLALVLLLVTAGPAQAQDESQDGEVELLKPRARQGYYLGGGPRVLTLAVDDEDFGGLGGMLGFGGSLRFGQKVLDWLGLGLMFTGGVAGNEDWGFSGGGLLLEVQAQPWVETDLAFRFGIGVSGFGVSRADANAETDDDPSGTVGAMYLLAFSYELFPFYEAEKYESGGLAFSFFVEGQITPGLGGLTSYGASIGIELTWWSGLSRNKLDLPVDAAFIDD